MASSTVSENTETQSSVRQAGTSPRGRDQPQARLQPDDVVEHRGYAGRFPRLSVPSASGTSPVDHGKPPSPNSSRPERDRPAADFLGMP